jgi:hypothetical protein
MARDSEGGLVSIAYLSAGLALSPIETNSLSELSIIQTIIHSHSHVDFHSTTSILQRDA